MKTDMYDLAEALASAFGLVARDSDLAIDDARWYETPAGRRSVLMARSNVVSLRHGDGWNLVVSIDHQGQSARAEVTGQYLPPSAIDLLRYADQRTGGVLRGALGRGRHTHTRYVARVLVPMRSQALLSLPGTFARSG